MSTIWQRPWIRAITTILVIALMTGIFLFSNQGKQSETTSESFAFVIIDTVHPEYQEATTEEQYDIWNTAQRIARKAAHIVEYLALGFLIRLCLESWFGYKPKWKWIAFAIGAAFAASDEIHQYFVPGRSCEVLDVLIDSLGVFLGVLLAVWLIRSVARNARRDYTMEPWSKKKLLHSLLLTPLFGGLLTICLELGLNFLRPGNTGSLLLNLAIFAIFTVLMAAAVWLCAFTQPIRKLWNWLDQNLLNPETRKPALDITYAVLAAVMLLHHFYVILYYPKIPAGAVKLAPAWIILAALTILMGRTWRNRSFVFSALFLIFTFERLYLKNLTLTGEDSVYFSSAIYAFFLAYGVFFVLRPAYRKTFLQVLCGLWSISILVLSAASLYTAWTGDNIKNLAGEMIHIFKWELRLWIFANPVISAANIGCGSIMMLVGFSITKKKLVKVLYLLACLISLITISLTDSRSSMIMLSFALAGMVTLILWELLARRTTNQEPKKRILLLTSSLLVSFAIAFMLSMAGQRALMRGFVQARDHKGLLISSALADEIQPADSVLSQRDSWDSGLSGRINIWKDAQAYIQEYPDTLVTGMSVDGSVAEKLRPKEHDHLHSMFVQTIMEGGIPGLMLFLAILAYFLFHAVNIWRHWDLPLWQRMMPLAATSILVLDVAECLSHFSFGHSPITILYFFMGCTVATSLSLKKKSADDTAPQAAGE